MSKAPVLSLTQAEIFDSFSREPWASKYPPVLSVEQAADLLQVSIEQLLTWHSQGKLKQCSRRCGTQRRFFRDRLVKTFFAGESQRDPVASCPAFPSELSYGLVQRRRRWYCFVRGLGRQFRRSLKTSDPEEARRRADALIERLQRDSLPTTDKSSRNTKLSEVIEAYCLHVEAEHLAVRTIAKYRWVMKQVQRIARSRNAITIADIDLGFLDAYRLRRSEDQAAPKTIYSEVITIKQLLNFAVNRGYLATSPLKGIRIRRPKSRPQPFWTVDQMKLILEASSRSPYHDLYLVLSETGMRVGEAKFLTWDDVDLERRVLFVREKQIGRKATERWKPKTGEQRVVPLSPRIVQLLSSARRASKWVLTRPNRNGSRGKPQAINDRAALGHLKRILKKLGLKGHVHTFRHSFISHALVSGIPEAVVRDWVGHVDPQTIRQYTHIADAQSHICMDHLFAEHSTSGVDAVLASTSETVITTTNIMSM